MVFQLTDELVFPDPRLGEPDGLIAVGGDYSTERLLLAYSNGIFPWSAFRNEQKLWFCPMQRFVIFPNEIHISHSMKSLIRKQKYTVTINHDFDGVIHNCGALRHDQEGAWLGEEVVEAFTRLHRLGWATSLEVWEQHNLVGGLYGVTIGNCFIGESMFSLVPSASKLALIALAQFMADNGGTMIDCQLETPHLRSMGGRFIPYDEYMTILSGDINEE